MPIAPRSRRPRLPPAEASAEARRMLEAGQDGQASAAIFLVLRRLRAPLIVLVLVFAVSVLGLTLIPGEDNAGRPVRMGVFDAFYFMSYTATTIGFGELPYPFTDAQRLWVIVTIYSTVVAWAYAIGSLLTLLQDRAFRQALALQHFQRKVTRLGEPFVIVAGFGQTGTLLAASFDALGRRLVVLDRSADRIDALELTSFHGDIAGLVADVSSPQHLRLAGLLHPCCEGVLAVTDDDTANLAVTMAAALLRPELPVVARTLSPEVGERMRAFGTPTVVNPFDRFGERLLLSVRSPASFRLTSWLEAGPGAVLPPPPRAPREGRWVVCGYGRFGRALTYDLLRAGLEVTVVAPAPTQEDLQPQPGLDVVTGDASAPDVLDLTRLEQAVGLVAATDDDTTNLSLVAAARRRHPDLFVIARQNAPADAPLFAAMDLDALLVPSELVAHEAYAHLSTPLLWRFLQEQPARGDAWAADLVDEIVQRCGERLPEVWKVRLTAAESPALEPWLAGGGVALGHLLRHPEDRGRALSAVVLLLQRDGDSVLTPGADHVLAAGDQLLLVGTTEARRALDTTLHVDAAGEHVVTGQRRPAGWLWRRLADRRARSGRSAS